MTLQERIYNDLREALRKKEESWFISDMKVIVGELQRMPSKVLSDEEVIRILRKLSNMEEERIKAVGKLAPTTYLHLLDNYIPKQVNEEEIRKWINNNIDFSKFRNKFQAVGKVLEHFGTRTDGNTVKNIISTME